MPAAVVMRCVNAGNIIPAHLNCLTHWGRDKMDDIFQTTFSNAFSWMKIYEFRLSFSLKFVPKGPINKIPALVQIMAWRLPGDKPLSEPTLVSLLTHICVTRPQWVNSLSIGRCVFGLKCLRFRGIVVITFMSISSATVFKWMAQDPTDEKSTMDQVMAQCHQATSHYLNQCWARSMLPCSATWPQWV